MNIDRFERKAGRYLQNGSLQTGVALHDLYSGPF